MADKVGARRERSTLRIVRAARYFISSKRVRKSQHLAPSSCDSLVALTAKRRGHSEAHSWLRKVCCYAQMFSRFSLTFICKTLCSELNPAPVSALLTAPHTLFVNKVVTLKVGKVKLLAVQKLVYSLQKLDDRIQLASAALWSAFRLPESRHQWYVRCIIDSRAIASNRAPS